MALLTLEQFEQRFTRIVALRGGVDHGMRLERSDDVRYRAEVTNDAVQVRIVEPKGRHLDAQPRTNLDRSAEERIQPFGLHAGALRGQHRRPHPKNPTPPLP